MMTFRDDRLARLALPPASAWLLSDIGEHKGRQQLYTRQMPQVLKALRDMALVQSVESSNRIEGVTVAPDRLRPLVLGRATPADRAESEIRGYREALNEIHTRADSMKMAPELFRHLHATIQSTSGDAGEWKQHDNEIVVIRPGLPPEVRFSPVQASATPAAAEELCASYLRAVEHAVAPALITLAALVLDFLCIHPFRDGNGRVSRLITLLGTYQHGYEVGRYVSLERTIEDSREDYYEALRRSSAGWHDGKHDFEPWLNYFLTVMRRAYREFEERVGQVKGQRGAKRASVLGVIDRQAGTFSLVDLERLCPGVSRDMIRRVLWDLQKAGAVECVRRGPAAQWQRVPRW